MKTRGRRFNRLQLPPGLHFCVTMPQTLVADLAERLTADLREGVKYAKTKAGTVAEATALCGLAGTVEGKRQVNDLIFGMFDYLYAV